MGPDFLDRQCLWYMLCCNLICVLFLIQNSFSSRISGKRNRISGRIPDIKKGRISGRISGATLVKKTLVWSLRYDPTRLNARNVTYRIKNH